MNEAQIHLMVNHLPIVGIIVGLLILIAGYLLKKNDVKATALGVFIFSAITSIPAFFSGEEAEELIEDMPEISETLMHTHEEYAELFFSLTLILGALALITLYLVIKKLKWAKYGYLLVFVLAIASSVQGKLVGTSGGEIRHSEIREDGKVIQLDNHNEHDDD